MDELQSRMSSIEFARWQAFAELEPFGLYRVDRGDALIATILANQNRSKDSDPIVEAHQLVPELGRDLPEPDEWEQHNRLAAKLGAITAGFGVAGRIGDQG